MKFGTKSHLISAYSALFTVAVGVLLWDFVRRSSTEDPQDAKTAPVARTSDAASLPG